MRCQACGAELTESGPGAVHHAAPTGWTVTTVVVIGLAALFAGLTLANVAFRLAVPDPSHPATGGLATGLVIRSLLWFVSIVGLAIAFRIWIRAGQQLAEAHGAPALRYVRNWAMRLWS